MDRHPIIEKLFDLYVEIKYGLHRYVDPQEAKVNLEVEISRLEDQLWYEIPSTGNDDQDWYDYQQLLARTRAWVELPF